MHDRLRRRTAIAFGVASFLTIALGAVVMAQADVSVGIWIRNLIAWGVAALVALLLARAGWPRSGIALVALAVIAASFLGAEQEGVHRWLGLGPIQLNAAALVLPAAIAAFDRERTWLAIPCFVLIGLALAWQPDISQLSALGLAALILAAARFGWRGAAVALAAGAALIALCLSRPDPLEPVVHVEGIFWLAWSQSPLLAIAMGAALAASALSPLLLWQDRETRWAAAALASYSGLSALAFIFGAYPVPLAGYGLSFVVGWMIGVSVLLGRGKVNSLTSP